MKELYYIIFFEPIINLLIYLYNFISDFGILIIVLTIITRIILWPFTQAGLKSQSAMLSLQPKIENLKRKYKDDKEALAKATMELYKTEKVNPFSSCFVLLIQLPFMIALFQVLMLDITKDAQPYLYSFINMPLTFDRFSLVFGDLSKPNIILAVLAGLAQFWQSKQIEMHRPVQTSSGQQTENMAMAMQKQMLYIMPIMTVVIGITLPGGLSLYWLITTLLLVLQQEYFFRNSKNGQTLAKI